MKLSGMSRALMVLILFVIAASNSRTQAQGQCAPRLTQRRLVNLSGHTAGHRRLLNLSGNTVGHRRLLNLSGNTVGHRRLLNLRGGNTVGERRLLNLSGNAVEPTEVPESLLVERGNKLHKVLRASGLQEYVYENGNWTLYNASAALRTFAGEDVGVHYFLPRKTALGGQPTWKSFEPESLCTGAVTTKVAVSQDAIPWLLLKATDISGSSRAFGEVTYVQRLYTENGLAPDASYAATPGETFESPYTAIYFFYRKG